MNVTLHTNLGDINITMFPDHSPKTVANFVGLAKGPWTTRTMPAARARRPTTTAWAFTASSPAS
jgi:cyclophilin family peptidyl-prolyl cis-trans isomerase